MSLGASGVLFAGASGAGKSTLALSLLALGAQLVSDDKVQVSQRDGVPWLDRPPDLPPWIESRGLGLLGAEISEGAWLRLVVDLDETEPQRLPPRRHVVVCGAEIPLVYRVDSPHFPSALLHYLKFGRRDGP